MTDAERQSLNERIALRLGYTYENGLWNAPEGEPLYGLKDPPDFTCEWNHTGPLLEKLYTDGWRIWEFRPGINTDTRNNFYFRQIGIFGQGYFDSKTKELTEAIALAYDAWREDKK